MKSAKSLATGIVMVLSLIGVSSASAANWDPQNQNVIATQEGSGQLTGSGGVGVSCTSGETTLRAAGAEATTITTTNPVTFDNCTTTGPMPLQAFVTTFGDWSFTATNTTDVDITATSNTGTIATIHVPLGGCEIRVPSPVHITGTWSNTNHTLSVASSGIFAVHSSAFPCTLTGTTASIDSNFFIPSATIT